jgi:eukaryotic-like serine/threonine-protein kinase
LFSERSGKHNGTKVNGVTLAKGETRKLLSGDEIYAGRTTMSIDIQGEPSSLLQGAEVRCMECNKILTGELSNEKHEESIEIIYCKECREKKAKIPVKINTEEILCHSCNKNMTHIANKDGKGQILKQSTLYFCHDCRPQGVCNELGDYELIKLMASGGMGDIYKAWHKLTGRIVVLKKISPQMVMEEKTYKLFRREIDVMSGLNHPNIVHLYEYGRTGNIHYFVTEFMNGGDTGDLIRKKLAPLSYKMACNIICQVLEGLEFAHSRNYIHRDIKPENILLHKDKSGIKAKLSDFGLAKNFQDAGGSMLTQGREVMGSLLFMSPEQLRNYKNVKPPADIFSMGVTFYYLLTGKYIYNYPSPLDILLAGQKGEKVDLNRYDDPFHLILEAPPIPVEKQTGNIPERLALVVNKSIAKNVKDRYLTAKEFKEDIVKAIGTQ